MTYKEFDAEYGDTIFINAQLLRQLLLNSFANFKLLYNGETAERLLKAIITKFNWVISKTEKMIGMTEIFADNTTWGQITTQRGTSDGSNIADNSTSNAGYDVEGVYQKTNATGSNLASSESTTKNIDLINQVVFMHNLELSKLYEGILKNVIQLLQVIY